MHRFSLSIVFFQFFLFFPSRISAIRWRFPLSVFNSFHFHSEILAFHTVLHPLQLRKTDESCCSDSWIFESCWKVFLFSFVSFLNAPVPFFFTFSCFFYWRNHIGLAVKNTCRSTIQGRYLLTDDNGNISFIISQCYFSSSFFFYSYLEYPWTISCDWRHAFVRDC